MGEFDAFAGECGGHDVGGLFLFIDFAAVGDGGKVEEIYGDVGAVIPVPEFLFPRRRGNGFVLEDAEEFFGFGKPGAGGGGGEFAGIVDRELPAGSAAHRETADNDAIFIDAVTFLHVGERFEEIDLAGEFVGVTIAAVKVQDEGVGGNEFAGGTEAVVEEFEFGEFLVAAVEPGVEAAGTFGGEVV